jgi:hypothetical protein
VLSLLLLLVERQVVSPVLRGHSRRDPTRRRLVQ